MKIQTRSVHLAVQELLYLIGLAEVLISFQSEIWTEIMTWILLLPIKPRMKWYGMRMTGPPIFHLVELLLPHWTVWISPDTLN